MEHAYSKMMSAGRLASFQTQVFDALLLGPLTPRTFCPLRSILSCAFRDFSSSRKRNTSSSGGNTNGLRVVTFAAPKASSCAIKTREQVVSHSLVCLCRKRQYQVRSTASPT